MNQEEKAAQEQNVNAKDLEEKLQACEKQKSEYLAGWQRARADFLNYKKDEMERIQELIGYAKEEFLLNTLPILDNFEQAIKKLPREKLEDEDTKGLLQIKEQLLNYVKKLGAEEMEVAGKKFDPNFHEAVGEELREDTESGTVVEEIQKGYMIGDRVLRAAKVKVAK